MPEVRGHFWGSVRGRVTLTATAAVALALIAAVAGLTYTVDNTLAGRARDEAEARVAEVAARIDAGVPPSEALAVEHEGGAVTPPTPVQIIDENGEIIGASGDLVRMRTLAPVPTFEAPQVRVVTVGHADLVIASRSVVVDGQRLNVVAISPLAEAARSVAVILRTSAIGAPLLLLLVGVVTWRATGRTLRPIDQIRAEVDELSSRTLSRRVPVPDTDDEVASLARTMNMMLDRLEKANDRQEAFVSDASHELRSPVAAIRTQLEVALVHPESGEWRTVAGDVLAEAGRMERLIDDLLLLAQLDEQRRPPTERVSLSACIEDVIERVNDDRITVETAGAPTVAGHGTQLAVVVRNLVDNAARHALSRIQIRAEAKGVVVEVVVSDDGPGVPPEHRERIFERFARLDQARTRTDGGVGLGLAVAKRIAEHHGGSLTVHDSPLGGAAFHLALPASPGETS